MIRGGGLLGLEDCPKCGSRMERGYVPVSNVRGLQWSNKKHKWLADSWFQEGVESLTGAVWWSVLNLEAHLCRKCRIITLEY